jgi:hypothetical protein
MTTITYVGIGSTAVAVNAAVVPSAVAGIAAGDLALILCSIRNSGAGAPAVPAGWSRVVDAGNLAVLGRYWQAGDTAPTVTFTGGVANADTQAAMIAFRGVLPGQLTAAASAQLLNGSAQNIAYPALDVAGAGRAVIVLGWKQDDSTTVSTPAGFSTMLLSSVTTGDDATLAARYIIETTEVDIGAGSLTVTGGAAAISRGVVLALRAAPAFTAVAQDVWPPRVLLTASGLDPADSIDVFRLVGGVRTPVRGGFATTAGATAFTLVDAELPFGIPVSYVLQVNNVDAASTSPVTYVLTGGNVALTDAISAQAAEVVIVSWPGRERDSQSAVFAVDGRNLVVSAGLGQYLSTVQLFVATTSASDALLALLKATTSGIVQVRQAGGYDGVDGYWSVLAASDERFSQDGTDERRLWTLNVAECDGWSVFLQARGWTLQDIANAYTGLTLQDYADDYATLLLAAQGDYGI